MQQIIITDENAEKPLTAQELLTEIKQHLSAPVTDSEEKKSPLPLTLSIALVVAIKNQLPWENWSDLTAEEAKKQIGNLQYDLLDPALKSKITAEFFKKIVKLSTKDFNLLLFRLAPAAAERQLVHQQLLFHCLRKKAQPDESKQYADIALQTLKLIYKTLPRKKETWKAKHLVDKLRSALLKLTRQSQAKLFTEAQIEFLVGLTPENFIVVLNEWQVLFNLSPQQLSQDVPLKDEKHVSDNKVKFLASDQSLQQRLAEIKPKEEATAEFNFTNGEGNYSYFSELAESFSRAIQFDTNNTNIPFSNLIFCLRQAFEKQANIELTRKDINGKLVAVFDRRQQLPLDQRKSPEHPHLDVLNVLLTITAVSEKIITLLNFQPWPPEYKKSMDSTRVSTVKRIMITSLIDLIKAAADINSILVTNPQKAISQFADSLRENFKTNLNIKFTDKEFDAFVVLAYGLWSASQLVEEKLHIVFDEKTGNKMMMRVIPIINKAEAHQVIISAIQEEFKQNPYTKTDLLAQHFAKDKCFKKPMLQWMLYSSLDNLKGVLSPSLQKFTDLFPKHSYKVLVTMLAKDDEQIKTFNVEFIRTGAPGSQFISKEKDTKEKDSKFINIRNNTCINATEILEGSIDPTTTILFMTHNFKLASGARTPKYGHEHLLSEETVNLGKEIKNVYGVSVPSVDGDGEGIVNTTPNLDNLIQLFSNNGVQLNFDEKIFPGVNGKNLVERFMLGGQAAILFMSGIWFWDDAILKAHFSGKFSNRKTLYNDYLIPLLNGQTPKYTLTKQEKQLLLDWIKDSLPFTLYVFHCLAGKDRTTIMHMHFQSLLLGIINFIWEKIDSGELIQEFNRLLNSMVEIFINFIGYVYPGTNGLLAGAYPDKPEGKMVLNATSLSHLKVFMVERYRKGLKALKSESKSKPKESKQHKEVVEPSSTVIALHQVQQLRSHFAHFKMLQLIREVHFLLVENQKIQATSTKEQHAQLILQAFGIGLLDFCPDFLYQVLPQSLQGKYQSYPSQLLTLAQQYATLDKVPSDRFLALMAEKIPVNLQAHHLSHHATNRYWPMNRPDNASLADDLVHILLPALGILYQTAEGQWLIRQGMTAEIAWENLKQFVQHSYERDWMFADSKGKLRQEWVAIFKQLESKHEKLYCINAVLPNDAITQRLLAISLGANLLISPAALPFNSIPQRKVTPVKLQKFYAAEWTFLLAVINTHLQKIISTPKRIKLTDRKDEKNISGIPTASSYYDDWKRITELGWLLSQVRVISEDAADYLQIQFPRQHDCMPVPIPDDVQILFQYTNHIMGKIGEMVEFEYENKLADHLKQPFTDIIDLSTAISCFIRGMSFYSENPAYKRLATTKPSIDLGLSKIFFERFIPDFYYLFKITGALIAMGGTSRAQKIMQTFYNNKAKNYALEASDFIQQENLQQLCEQKTNNSATNTLLSLLVAWQQPPTVSLKVQAWDDCFNQHFAKLVETKVMSPVEIMNNLVQPFLARSFYLYRDAKSINKSEFEAALSNGKRDAARKVVDKWLKNAFNHEWKKIAEIKSINDKRQALISLAKIFFKRIGFTFATGSLMAEDKHFWSKLDVAALGILLQYLARDWNLSAVTLGLFIETCNINPGYVGNCLAADNFYRDYIVSLISNEILRPKDNDRLRANNNDQLLRNSWDKVTQGSVNSVPPLVAAMQQNLVRTLCKCVNVILDACIFDRSRRINPHPNPVSQMGEGNSRSLIVAGYLQLVLDIAKKFDDAYLINQCNLINLVNDINSAPAEWKVNEMQVTCLVTSLTNKAGQNVKDIVTQLWKQEAKIIDPSPKASRFPFSSRNLSSSQSMISRTPTSPISIGSPASPSTPKVSNSFTGFFNRSKPKSGDSFSRLPTPLASPITSTGPGLQDLDHQVILCLNRILQYCNAELYLFVPMQIQQNGFAQNCISLLKQIATQLGAQDIVNALNVVTQDHTKVLQ